MENIKIKKKYFLGIFECHSDTSAAISKNGKIIAYSEEERFNRDKHSPAKFPEKSIRFCLRKAKINPNQINAIGINWNTSIYDNGEMKSNFNKNNKLFNIDDNTLNWQKRVISIFSTKNFKKRIQFNWKKMFGDIKCPKIISSDHHYNHAFQTYFNSGFKKSLCITVDGYGDNNCTVIWDCEKNKIKPYKQISYPNSLGWFYSAFTEFFGFDAYDGEYKLMGLASYGNANLKFREKLEKIIKYDHSKNTYCVDPYFIHYGKHSWSDRFTDNLPKYLNLKPLSKKDKFPKKYYDLAYEVQKLLEDTVINLVNFYMNKLNHSNLCIGGGVGLNIKMNTSIYNLNCVKKIHIHPLCYDGGSSTSSAQIANLKVTGDYPKKINTLFLGESYSNSEIRKILVNNKIKFKKIQNPTTYAAKLLASGSIIGWFQGRAEAGPRALGNRSILADPRYIKNRDKVNKAIKYREMWRPFCPSILDEFCDKFLYDSFYAPHMIISFRTKDIMKKIAPAVVHVDNTARVQSVNQKDNEIYYKLIKNFYKITKVPILLNTSFNLKGEPIVNNPNDALRTFYSSSLDFLFINDYLITK